MALKVNIKWGREKFKDVALDTTAPPTDFMATVYSLTGVPVDRQKLMCRRAWKRKLTSDADFSAMPKLKNGLEIMLIGSSTGIPKPSVAKTNVVFAEDMAVSEEAAASVLLPPGLSNLGNTCYLNSTLQCLKAIPELRNSIREYKLKGIAASDTASSLTKAMGNLFDHMDNRTGPRGKRGEVVPFEFVQIFRNKFPQYAEQVAGNFKQQDAEEVQSVLLSHVLHKTLKEADGKGNLVSSLFGFKMENTLVCQENDKEPPVVKTDIATKLICNIRGGGGSHDHINHAHQGILLGLENIVEKRSVLLGRNAQWKSSSKVDSLPRIICLQFMRFFWKATPDSHDHEGVKCKITRPVAFDTILDMYPYCSKRLQAILKVPRDKYAAEVLAGKEVKKVTDKEGKKVADKTESTASAAAATKPPAPPAAAAAAAAATTAMDVESEDDDDGDAALKAALALSKGMMDVETETASTSAAPATELSGQGLPANFRGRYELFAVVTHEGGSADGGHYMGWVRQSGDNWLCFDDDEVDPCTTFNILKLKANASQRGQAYLTFYRFKE